MMNRIHGFRKACYLMAFLLFTGIGTGMAQEKIKFGDVPASDLSMTVYPEDTTAIAVVLHESCEVRYIVVKNAFHVKTYYTVRMKVLKPAGLNQANIFIPFYSVTSREQSEQISGITGYTYNLVNGKTERTKLSKEYIFEEKTSDRWRRMKIAFPNVKVGSIFEVKYEKTSPYIGNLEDFVFQRSIPVKYSHYQVTIPEYYKFRRRTGGYEKIDYTEKKVGMSFSDGSNRLSCSGQEMTFVATNLPAMKNDSHVWNVNDYLTRIIFDLMSLDVSGMINKNFTATWSDIDKQLLENDQFGKQLSISNLMKDELNAVLKNDMKSNDKVIAILDLVKSKIQWNDEYALYIDNVRKAVRDGKGSSAEMNAALICLLRDAGFDSYPVVMSLRSRGRIFSPFPTLKSLNYFLTGVVIDGKPSYVDASNKYGTVNVIPVDCMVEEARCIFKDKPGTFVDLHELGRNVSMINITAEFNDEGILSGFVQRQLIGAPCLSYHQKIDKQKSVDDTREEMETDMNIRISNLEQGEPQNAYVTEKFSFESTASLGGDMIYLNPLIFSNLKDNPFKAETRKLPVEFPFPYNHTVAVVFTIPDGYELIETPVAEIFNLNDRQMSFTYQVQKFENAVQVTQQINIRQTLYPVTEYEHVRDFWARVADKNNAQMVLKRVANN